jgi:hypothetical protein
MQENRMFSKIGMLMSLMPFNVIFSMPAGLISMMDVA